MAFISFITSDHMIERFVMLFSSNTQGLSLDPAIYLWSGFSPLLGLIHLVCTQNVSKN